MSRNQPTTPQWLPALGWLRAYDLSWLRGDVVAGITSGMAAAKLSIPISIIIPSSARENA
jgi:MFS superfamily sulfate permease-like transporter